MISKLKKPRAKEGLYLWHRTRSGTPQHHGGFIVFDPLWRFENSKACLTSQLLLIGVLLTNASQFCLWKLCDWNRNLTDEKSFRCMPWIQCSNIISISINMAVLEPWTYAMRDGAFASCHLGSNDEKYALCHGSVLAAHAELERVCSWVYNLFAAKSFVKCACKSLEAVNQWYSMIKMYINFWEFMIFYVNQSGLGMMYDNGCESKRIHDNLHKIYESMCCKSLATCHEGKSMTIYDYPW